MSQFVVVIGVERGREWSRWAWAGMTRIIGTGYSKLMIYFDSIFQAKPEDSASDKYLNGYK